VDDVVVPHEIDFTTGIKVSRLSSPVLAVSGGVYACPVQPDGFAFLDSPNAFTERKCGWFLARLYSPVADVTLWKHMPSFRVHRYGEATGCMPCRVWPFERLSQPEWCGQQSMGCLQTLNSFVFALQIAAWQHFRDVILVGVDMIGDKYDSLVREVERWSKEPHGMRWWSASPHSRLNDVIPKWEGALP
jgi:hypothetical protein